MLTVPQAARRTRKHPETIRRWIREGKLAARKVGTQHVIDEVDLDGLMRGARSGGYSSLGREMVAIVRQVRETGKEQLISVRGTPVAKVVPYGQDRWSGLEALRGSVLRFERPTEPVAERDWKASK